MTPFNVKQCAWHVDLTTPAVIIVNEDSQYEDDTGWDALFKGPFYVRDELHIDP